MRSSNNISPQQHSFSEEAEQWNAPGSSTDNTSFSLKTSSGVLGYKANDNNKYTDFLRVTIAMLLAFNAGEIDPEFKKVINRALIAYETGEPFSSEDDEENGDEDFVQHALSNARMESNKYEEAAKFVSTLPKDEKYKIQILHLESEDNSNIERILAKKTDLPPPLLHEVIYNHKPFDLPAEKAKEVYVQLRMLDVFVNISIINEGSKTNILKKVAAKTCSSKHSNGMKKLSKRNSKCKISEIKDLEKLSLREGVIEGLK